MLCALLLFATVLLTPNASQAQVVDLLPDMIIDPIFLSENRVIGGGPFIKLLRVSVATANIGVGWLEVSGGPPVGPGQQQVFQRIYQSDGSSRTRVAGTFVFHPPHGHVHFENWTNFRIREITEGDGVGPILAQSEKTSFCLLDLTVFDSSIALFPALYTTCLSDVQGITPGWEDIYDLDLPDQVVNITGVPDGFYWLEAEVDPGDNILESDETNNVSRVRIALGPTPPAEPDRYEENDSFDEVEAREEGAADSPNLGLVNARREIEALSVTQGDLDYFKFRMNNAAGPGDFVRIESPYPGSVSDLDLFLFDPDGIFLAVSNNLGNGEIISLAGLPAGEYFALVAAFSGENPGYTLTIEPAGNAPPTIELVRPEEDGIFVERALETVPVEWIASDPEGDPTRVSLSMDRDITVGKDTLPIGGYQNLSGEDGGANLLTAFMDLGEWFLYAQVTDGGAVADDWAPGSFTVYVKGDVDFDGHLDREEYKEIKRLFGTPCFPPEWEIIVDMDRDGDVDRRDLKLLKKAVKAEDAQLDNADSDSGSDSDSDSDRLNCSKRRV